MPATQPYASESAAANTTTELDIYAAEFAKLVSRYSPYRTETPADWLSRLPNEAFAYYQRGASTFGQRARSPIERRGRLYLIHTALVFMWMKWGKETAREQFKSHAQKGTHHATSLITLEHYKRGDVLSEYRVLDWFFQPVNQWRVSVISAAVDADEIPHDDLRRSVRRKKVIRCSIDEFAMMRSNDALPKRADLTLE